MVDLQQVEKLHKDGLTNVSISKELSISAVHAGRLVRKLGLSPHGRCSRDLLVSRGKGKCSLLKSGCLVGTKGLLNVHG